PKVVNTVWNLIGVAYGIRLLAMNEVGKLGGIADEEDRQVVAHKVPVAILGAELHGETARVACQLGAAAAASHRAEPDAERCLLPLFLEKLGAGVFAGRLITDGAVGFELAVSDH